MKNSAFAKLFGKRRRNPQAARQALRRDRARRRLLVEPLEDRRLLTTNIMFAGNAAFSGDGAGATALVTVDGQPVTFTTLSASNELGTAGTLDTSLGLGINTNPGDGNIDQFNAHRTTLGSIGERWSFEIDTGAFVEGLNFGAVSSGEFFDVQSDAWINLSGIAPASGSVTYTSASGTFTFTDNGAGNDDFTLADMTGGTALAIPAGADVTVSFRSTFSTTDRATLDELLLSVPGSPINLDFGDAPSAAQSGFASSYPVTIAENGARHNPAGPFLGATRDVEADGTPSANADADGADEDGVTFGALNIGGMGSATVVVSGVSSRVTIFIDLNQNGTWTDPGELVYNQVLGTGSNPIMFPIPGTATAGTTFARVRAGTVESEINIPTGPAANGEVEDYQVTLAAAAPADPTSATVMGGVLTIADTDATGKNNQFTLSKLLSGDFQLTDASGATIDVSSISGAMGTGTSTVTIPTTGITSIVINGALGNDSLNVNFTDTGGNPVPSGGLTFDGGAGTDGLGIKGDGSAIVSRPDGSTLMSDPKSGKINVGAQVDAISYSGIEPLDIDGGGGPVTIAPTGGADVLTIGSGVNLTSSIVPVGTQPAIIVSGTTGGGFFESHAVWNASLLTINTVSGGTDGADAITVNATTGTGAAAVTSLAITTGTGTDTVAINGAVVLAGSLSVNTVNVSSTAAGTISTGTGLSVTNTGTASSLVGAISGSGATLTKAGAGSLTLSGSSGNTYTGLTTVSAGTLTLGKSSGNAVGGNLSITTTGKVTFTANNQIADTAAVSMSGAGSVFNGTGVNAGTFAVTETIGSLTVTGGAFNSSTGVWTVTGAASFTGGAGNTIVVGNSGSRHNFGSLSLTAMTATAGGTVATNNSFTLYGNSATQSFISVGSGGLALNGSVLNLRRGGAGTNGSRLIVNGNVSTSGTAASSISEDVAGGVNGAIAVELSGTAGAFNRTIDVGGGGANLTIGIPVTNGAATPGGIIKDGVGTLTLSGTNTYAGKTTVANGTLLLSNASNNNIANSTTIEVGLGATLDVTGLNSGRLDLASGQTLQGEGTVTGAVRALSGSTIAPGTSSGILNVGNTTFTSGSFFDVEIQGVTTAGVDYDQLNVTGSIDLGGATLNLIDLFAGTGSLGNPLILINNDLVDPVMGTFNGIVNGGNVTFNGETWRLFYNGGDGNDVVLTFVPATLTDIYVNNNFTAPNGTFIMDADPNTAGNQNAVIGVNAFATIQAGVNAVDSGGNVSITDDLSTDGAGTYGENVVVNKNVTIRGTEADATAVIVNGGGAGSVFSIGAFTVTLDALTIQNGAAFNGGGINSSGVLMITGSVIQNNVANGATGSGGGIFSSGTLTVMNSTISGNDANRAGGGIEIASGSGLTTLTNVLLNSNDALGGGAGAPGNGGGLHITGAGNVNITGGTVNLNTAALEGGGLWNGSGTMTVDGTTINGNQAFGGTAADDGGGGIFNNGGTLNVQNVTMTNNVASTLSGMGLSSGGGILSIGAGTVTVTDSTIAGNSALRAGGGIEIGSGANLTTLTNVMLNNNQALGGGAGAPGNGGGLHITGAGNVNITGGMVDGNTAALEGGGLWNGSGTMTVGGTTISFNQALGGAAADDGGGGIFNNGGTLNVQNGAMITNNVASTVSGMGLSSGGGILSIGAGTVTVTDSTIAGNSALRAGGGIEIGSGAGLTTLTNVMLNFNNAQGGGAGAPGNGGGLHITGSGDVNITGGTVNFNTAALEGGGLWNGGGTMTVDGTEIDGNFALGGAAADDGGGGIFNNGGTLIVQNGTLITNNVASTLSGMGLSSGGGILSIGAGTVTVTDSNISGNFALRAGGGIEIGSGAGLTTLTNVMLNGNNAFGGGALSPGNGGGLHITGAGNVNITGGMVDGNIAAEEGGGLWNAGGTMTIDGTSITNNQALGSLNPSGNVAQIQGGGGIFNNGGTVTMTANPAMISGNSAVGGPFGSGGGILSVGGTLNVSQVMFLFNTSARGGGAVHVANGAGNVTNNMFASNFPFDELAVDATENADSITVTASGITVGANTVTIDATVSDLAVFGLNGDDTINVTPSTTAVMNIFGGDPAAPASPGDTLVFTTPPGETVTNTPTGTDSGILSTTGGFLDVNYDEIETLALSGDVVVNGTANDDTLKVTATGRDSGSYVLTTNGVAGLTVQLVTITSLTFNGLDGDDVLHIDMTGIPGDFFAPSGGVLFNGGSQDVSAAFNPSDQLIIEGGATADTIVHRFDPASVPAEGHDGQIQIEIVALGLTGANVAVYTYTGLEPVFDNLDAVNREFTFLAGSETITLSAPGFGGLANLIGSTLGEAVSFNNPTGSLTINVDALGGTGPDTIDLNGIDAAFNADFTINAGADDTVNVNGVIAVGGGTIDVTANDIQFAGGRLETTGDVILSASAAITTTGAAVDVVALNLTASAATGIDLDTTVTNLTATNSGAGNVNIDETDGANVLNVSAANGDATVTSATGNLNVTSISASATATLTATAGAITDANGVGTNNVTANTLVASAATGINLDTTVANITATTSGAGAIMLREFDGVTLTSVTTANGAITITTGGNTLVTNVVSSIDNDANDISITASTGNITVVTVDAGTTAGDVTIVATTGSILDDDNDATRITGDVVTLTAAVDIGLPLIIGTEDVDTRANSITASTTNASNPSPPAHGIWIEEFDEVTLTSVTTLDGVIVVYASGTIRAVSVSAGGTGRNVLLQTGSMTSADILVGSVSAIGDIVKLDAAGAILDGDSGPDDNDVTAAGLLMFAINGIGTAANPLETTVSNLAANAGSGGIWLTNSGALTVTTVSAFGMTFSGVTAAGNVRLTVTDTAAAGENLTVNTTITVQSTGGNVTLQAGDDLTLQDSSTVSAAGVVTLRGDFGNMDAGVGSTISLLGTINSQGGTAIVEGDSDADMILLNPGVGHFATPIQLDGMAGDDTYRVWFGRLSGGANAVNVVEAGPAMANNDTLILEGQSIAETFNIDGQMGGTVVNLDTASTETITYSLGVENLIVRGNDGNDTFTGSAGPDAGVEPSQSTVITVDGGSPSFGQVGVPPGDTLIFDPLGNTFSIVGKTIFTNGGSPAYKGVNFLNIESLPLMPVGTAPVLRLDLNSLAGSPTQAGYTSLLPTDRYMSTTSGGTGYGWEQPLVSTGQLSSGGFLRTTALGSGFADLLRDGHFSNTAQVYRADVGDNGWYLVSVKLGDAGFARDQMQVRNADTGQVLVASTSTAAGQFAERNFVVRATAGSLRLEFRDLGGDQFWAANAIEIRPGVILDIGSPTPGPLDANGTTVDTFTIYEGTPGALAVGDLITVSTTLGTIVSVDQDPNLAGIQVRVTTAGQVDYQIRRPTGAGTALVSLSEVTGEHTGCVAIDYVLPSSRRFDFNSTTSPTQLPSVPLTPGGYIGVLPTDTYNSQRGYGWDVALVSTGSTQAGGYDRGDLPGTQAQEELRRDGHFAHRSVGPRTFSVDLPAATDMYLVNVTIGDTYARDAIQLTAEGMVQAVVNTAANQWTTISFVVTVSDGRLDLEVADLAGDPFWAINGLEIRPLSQIGSLTLTGPSGPLDADGATIDGPFTVTVPNGMLVTLATDKGTITGVSDASSAYAGLQVLGTGAPINFSIVRPASSGVATVTAIDVSGASVGTHTVTYQLAAVRRFDFNSVSNDTAANFIGVRGDNLFTTARGYGWTTQTQDFQRTSGTALLRDGAWASDRGARTFQVQVVPGAPYTIIAHVGDSFARDQIRIESEGGAMMNVANTAANQFVIASMMVTDDGDGILNITIRDLGGDPFWALNGLEVMLNNPLLAAGSPSSGGSSGAALTAGALSTIVNEAIARWTATGLSAVEQALLQSVSVQIVNLSASGQLAATSWTLVQIDDDAAGYGWFIDSTPADDSEFAASFVTSELQAGAGSPAAGRMDLLTVVMHELGHVLGRSHSAAPDLMADALSTGTRRLPTPASTSGSTTILAAANPLDVNRDGRVSPIDAFMIIDQLRREGPTLVQSAAQDAFDVNRDGRVTSIDAFLVIDHLRRGPAEALMADNHPPADHAHIVQATDSVFAAVGKSQPESPFTAAHRLFADSGQSPIPVGQPQSPIQLLRRITTPASTPLQQLAPHIVPNAVSLPSYPARRNTDVMEDQTRDELFACWDKLTDDWDELGM